MGSYGRRTHNEYLSNLVVAQTARHLRHHFPLTLGKWLQDRRRLRPRLLAADDTFFEPETLELTAGETVTIEVTNEGSTAHDFAIEELDLNTGTMEAGQVKSATLEVPEGTTKFRCTFHPEMEGSIEAR